MISIIGLVAACFTILAALFILALCRCADDSRVVEDDGEYDE